MQIVVFNPRPVAGFFVCGSVFGNIGYA